MNSYFERSRQGESGMALVITVLLLLMVSAIGLSTLSRSGDEKAVAAASRRNMVNLSAAEAGLRLIQERLYQSNKNQTTAPATLPSMEIFADETGLGTMVRSGAIGDTSPGAIEKVGIARGGELSVTKGGAEDRHIYRVSVTATDPSGGNTEIQAQFSVEGGGSGRGTYN